MGVTRDRQSVRGCRLTWTWVVVLEALCATCGGCGSQVGDGGVRAFEADLIRDLQRKRDPLERACAAAALGQYGSASAIGPLIRALSDPDPSVRGAAATGLGGLAARNAVRPEEIAVAIAPLLRGLEDSNGVVGAHCSFALSDILRLVCRVSQVCARPEVHEDSGQRRRTPTRPRASRSSASGSTTTAPRRTTTAIPRE